MPYDKCQYLHFHWFFQFFIGLFLHFFKRATEACVCRRRLFLTHDDVALYNPHMSAQRVPIVAFLKLLMRRRKLLPSQLAAELGVSHATVNRWLSEEDVPSTRSCRILAEYSGIPIQKILSISGHMPEIVGQVPAEWPEFREYALGKYRNELDEDLITMIEDLIERRRQKRRGEKDS